MNNDLYDDEGNLKPLPGRPKPEDDEKKFQEEPCIRIIKDQISSDSPLTCILNIQPSDKVQDIDRIQAIFNHATGKFKHMSQLSCSKVAEREFKVKIISGSLRCSWCKNFYNFLGERMGVDLIKQGRCLEFTSSQTARRNFN